ncbi:hypothetical protein D3C73_1319600 [compost metagenome]
MLKLVSPAVAPTAVNAVLVMVGRVTVEIPLVPAAATVQVTSLIAPTKLMVPSEAWAGRANRAAKPAATEAVRRVLNMEFSKYLCGWIYSK